MDTEVDELYDLSWGPTFIHLQSFFKCRRTCPGFTTAKELSLNVERGRILGPPETTCFALGLIGLTLDLGEVEEVELRVVPLVNLSSVLEYLCGASKCGLTCSGLERLCIEQISPFSKVATS